MPFNAFLDKSVVDIMIVLFLCFIGSSFFLTLHYDHACVVKNTHPPNVLCLDFLA